MTKTTTTTRDSELDGLPDLVVGSGPPLVYLPGLSSEHANPTGMERSMLLGMLGRLPEHFEVHVVNRRAGLPAGTTMADLAADVAEAIREGFDGPVPVVGMSTGGSIALQLAVDHPATVSRMVIVSGACRLGDRGRAVQRRLAAETRRGRHRRAWASVGSVMGANAVTCTFMAAAMGAMGPMLAPHDPSDLLAVIEAEDAFDATDSLSSITVPTLLVAGVRDRFYSPGLFHETAESIPGARMVLFAKSHAGAATYPPVLDAILAFVRG